MTKYLIILSFCFPSQLLGITPNDKQRKYQENKKLKAQFKEEFTRQQETSIWTTCNSDSNYYYSDTVRLFKNNYNYGFLDCCHNISWRFTSQNCFQLSQSDTCSEPPFETLILNPQYKIKYKLLNDVVYIQTYNSGNLIDTFLFLGFKDNYLKETGQHCRLLTLARLKQRKQ